MTNKSKFTLLLMGALFATSISFAQLRSGENAVEKILREPQTQTQEKPKPEPPQKPDVKPAPEPKPKPEPCTPPGRPSRPEDRRPCPK
jgi:outer membrane biosynthesis protein TonB